MSKRILIITAFILGLTLYKAHAQQNEFCDAINAIIRDAPNRFRNIKGKEVSASNTSMTWECGIKVPGSIASRVVLANGLFYEGAFFQTTNKNEIKAAYDKYKQLLDSCMPHQGYKLLLQDNFYPGLSDYKKLAYMPDIPEDTKLENAPGHVTMEAAYSKEMGKYTIVIYVFEH